MTDPRIAAIRARLEAATKGPWEKRPWHVAGQKSPPKWSISAPGRHIAMVGNANGQTKPAWEADADLIAAAPTDLAWLVGEVERLTAERDGLRASLIRACNATDGACHPTVSSEFLGHVGAEVEACIGKLGPPSPPPTRPGSRGASRTARASSSTSTGRTASR